MLRVAMSSKPFGAEGGYRPGSRAPIARPTTSKAPACRTCTQASAAYHKGHTGKLAGGSSGGGRRK